MSRAKIVATLGPATRNRELILALVEAGMDVARLNGAHADAEWHAEAIALLREHAPHVPVLLDLPGRKVRLGVLADPREVATGQDVVLTTGRAEGGKVDVTYDRLHEDVSPGDVILTDEGMLTLEVVEVHGRDIRCRAANCGLLQSGKGVNVPNVQLRSEIVTDRDRTMLAFAQKHEVDFVGVSFVETAEHVAAIRALLDDGPPRVIAKVENEPAFANLAEIAEAADGLMIDRGDLSLESGLDQLLVKQKRLIREGRRAGKPVIVATEMLNSMIESPLPLKAEVTDIGNAVLDGASALMLSAETAVGKYPTEAVALMRRIAGAASAYHQDSLDEVHAAPAEAIPEAIGDALTLITRRLNVTKIVAVTISGYAARVVAATSPRPPILAVTNDERAARSFNLLPGTKGIYVDIPFPRTNTEHIPKCLEELWRRGELVDDDLVLVTTLAYPRSGNRMNLIETHVVADLRDALGWS